MYPEVLAAQKCTIANLQRLILDCSRTPIHSEKELSEYYQEFQLISHNLITSRRMGMPEQGQQFLAGFQLAFALDIHSWLQLKLLDHFPLDPYRIEDIFEAALYTLRSQHSAPSIPSPRDVPLPFSLPSNRSQSIQVASQVGSTFPAASESSSSIKAAQTVQHKYLLISSMRCPMRLHATKSFRHR